MGSRFLQEVAPELLHLADAKFERAPLHQRALETPISKLKAVIVLLSY